MVGKCKCTVCVIPVLLIVAGLTLILTSPTLQEYIIRSQVVLKPGSLITKKWMNSPYPVVNRIYFFNWTNPEEIYNSSVKPHFNEVGPFCFNEYISKVNVTWNANGTVTYGQKRYWYFCGEENSESLHENITSINPTALGAAHVFSKWSYLFRKTMGAAFAALRPKIAITHSADEMLFKGYPESILKLFKTLTPPFFKLDFPLNERFGWMYTRNGSSQYEGIANMGTGVNSTIGKLYSSNYLQTNPNFDGLCSSLQDTSTGEFFEPYVQLDTLQMYNPLGCRTTVLEKSRQKDVSGIEGFEYEFGDQMLDNGTLYPENQCYCSGKCIPSGVLNISACRYGSPFFLSLPHFYKADQYYLDSIDGMKPEEKKHKFAITLEPTTNAQLEVRARMQLNILLHPIKDIAMFRDVPEIFMPVMWTEQLFTLPDNEIFWLKLTLKISTLFAGMGVVLIIIGLVLVLYMFRKNTKNKFYEKSGKQIPNGELLLNKKNQYVVVDTT